jgi:hypothetical protein
MLVRETVAVYCENHTEHTDTLLSVKLMHMVNIVHTASKNVSKVFICLACETSTNLRGSSLPSSQTVSPQVPETLVETIQFVFTHISPVDMNSI